MKCIECGIDISGRKFSDGSQAKECLSCEDERCEQEAKDFVRHMAALGGKVRGEKWTGYLGE